MKCKKALDDVKLSKENKRKTFEENRKEVNITDINNEVDDCVEIDGVSKQARTVGPIDQFARGISTADKKKQQYINASLFKSRTSEVHTYLARWVYKSGIPFNAINNDSFRRFVEAVGQFGPEYIPATQCQLREPLLKQAVKNTKESMKEQEDEWSDCKWSTQPKGIETYSTIVSRSFWTNLSFCVDLFKPLVKLLRLVDGDLKPSMGFMYGEFKDTKKEVIKICKDVREIYNPIMYIIDSRIKDRLDSPLHLTDYLLNPYYYYRDDEVKMDPNCMGALLTCVEAFFPDDFQTQNLVTNVKLHKYKKMEGIFSKKLVVSGRIKNDEHFNPGNQIELFSLLIHY
ncbi:uncharacterized protein LOC141678175 [Apium graveolens]|uniref:uncharacterized protein LOC141678175 n=1 Tax=Apium graveolens TaxID=4045 RepID=UPI003D7B8BBD